LLALTLISITLLAATAAHARGPKLSTLISEQIVLTWRCQEQIGVERTMPSSSPWSLPRSTAYRKWVLATWVKRKQACRKTLHAHDATIRSLQRGLAGTPMDGSAGDLLAAARRHRISPFFIAAIAGTESSFGAASCRGNPYNAFGLASCGSSWRVPYFPTWRSAYMFMGKFLTSRWPSATTTMHYYGYAACSDCWGRKTAEHMRARFGVGPSVRYAA